MGRRHFWRMKVASSALCAGAFFTCGTAAGAGPVVNDAGVHAASFQLLSFGDLLVNNTSPDGAVAAGGNVSASACSIGGGLGVEPGAVGVASSGNAVLYNGSFYGDVVVGGGALLDQSADLVGGRLRQTMPAIDFAAVEAWCIGLSDTLAAEPTTGATHTQPWGGIELRGLVPGLNVFAIDPMDFQESNGIAVPDFDPALHTIVINVAGVDVVRPINGTVFVGSLNAAQTYEDLVNEADYSRHAKVLWNFYEAESLVSENSIHGSVLAPRAMVEHQNGKLVGQVIAARIELLNAAEMPGGGMFAGGLWGDTAAEPSSTPGPGPSGGGASIDLTTLGTAYD